MSHPPDSARLPLAQLLALTMAAFITVVTEALPAGLMPQMSRGLAVSEAMIGQLVTAYALGTLLTAVPLTAATQAWRRRPLLLGAMTGFAVANTVTALSADFALTLAARFVAGISAGLLWALAAGYAARLVAPHLQGRAIAVAMAGIPVALSLGVPAGAFIGAAIGWRATFGIVTVLALGAVAWIAAAVPDFAGQPRGRGMTLRQVFLLPGVRAVLFVTLAYVLAHNVLYTYIAPFVAPAGLAPRLDAVLLLFGTTSLAGIWLTGMLIDRRLRELVLASTVLFGALVLALALFGTQPAVVWTAVALWGLAYGGVPTLFQTASAQAAGDAADVAQSMVVTIWNLAIAAAGAGGGLLLEMAGPEALPWALLALLIPALAVAWRASYGFPPVPRRAEAITAAGPRAAG
ncbi:MFS transporter [Pseudoduganella umbonata]|uniref:MFS transporter n=1 Tax=Pseudoduganella umbonata TaxID=864828 RepID=A0A4P8HSV1_9BURK|nr:MFS transporter [Pseudoduganella umbonata]MBB3222822.1 putative MFS family arabinose efflux permease [Pseudoduganella umbonata]QCP12959.1 MFS transporter [Pseudoduganella umbonata]